MGSSRTAIMELSPRALLVLLSLSSVLSAPLNPCWEENKAYVGFPLKKPGGNNDYGLKASVEECQAQCQAVEGCAWRHWAQELSPAEGRTEGHSGLDGLERVGAVLQVLRGERLGAGGEGEAEVLQRLAEGRTAVPGRDYPMQHGQGEAAMLWGNHEGEHLSEPRPEFHHC